MNERPEDPREVDSDSIESLHRAMRGEPRPIPDREPVPEFLVRNVVEAFNEIYEYDPGSGVPHEVHEMVCLVIWTEAEPKVLDRLQGTVEEMREEGLVPGDEWRAVPLLREWREETLDLVTRLRDRVRVEYELAAREDGMVETDRLVRGIGTILEEDGWTPEP